MALSREAVSSSKNVHLNYLNILLYSDSHLPKKLKALKNNEKCFLCHLKSFFRSQDIQVFVLTFW